MIETPTSVAIIRTEVADSEDPDAPLVTLEEKSSEKASLAEPELLLIKSQPITAKFRTTIRHLRSRAGRLSRFRGAKTAIAFHLMHSALTNLVIFGLGGQRILEPLAAIVVAIALCRINMTWTHVVISENSTKPWWRRYPSYQSGRKTVPAIALWAAAQQLTILMPAMLFETFNLARYVEDPARWGQLHEEGRICVLKQFFFVGLVAIATAILILIPATVTLKRVQASQLPEEDEGIVPFDRTFGGRVVPESAGGSGVLGVFEAWKSFDWAARIRLVKIYAKTIAIQIAVSVLFLGIVYGEMRLIMGDTLDRMIAAYADRVNDQSHT